MTPPDNVFAQLAERTGVSLSAFDGASFGERIAKALGWDQGSARIQTLETVVSGGTLSLTKGFLGPQPAVVFAANGLDATQRVFREAARFAYHSSVHWGVVADESSAIVFNSHWIRDDDWFRLPEILWSGLDKNIELLSAVTPEAIAEGRLVLQRQFWEGCGVMPAWRRGAWHGSVWPVRYCPAYPQATAATRLARTVPGAAFPAPPGRPAAS